MRNIPYFCIVKKKSLQIGSLLLALYLLFVALDLNVNFHLCTEDHHVMSSFGHASEQCMHCQGHDHEHHVSETASDVVAFNAKCCCEDYDSEIGFTDQFTFSTEKPLLISLPFVAFAAMLQVETNEEVRTISHCFTREKIPYLHSGRLKTIFFSSLRIDPDVC